MQWGLSGRWIQRWYNEWILFPRKHNDATFLLRSEVRSSSSLNNEVERNFNWITTKCRGSAKRRTLNKQNAIYDWSKQKKRRLAKVWVGYLYLYCYNMIWYEQARTREKKEIKRTKVTISSGSPYIADAWQGARTRGGGGSKKTRRREKLQG